MDDGEYDDILEDMREEGLKCGKPIIINYFRLINNKLAMLADDIVFHL